MREYAVEMFGPEGAKRWNGSLGALGRGREMHPDQGGPRADWDRLDEARWLLDDTGRFWERITGLEPVTSTMARWRSSG